MKKFIIAAFIASFFLTISASAQGKPGLVANNYPSTTTAGMIHTADSSPSPSGSSTAQSAPEIWANESLVSLGQHMRQTWVNFANTNMPAGNTSNIPVSAALTQTYRVGVGDVLDIQLPASLSTKSTLYTVLAGGLLDYPLTKEPLPIGGLTTEAIAARLRISIKVLDHPSVSVKVRDYASHAVKVIGFVSVPGAKLLRREAVPLYVVLSEAMPMSDATSATLIRAGRSAEVVDLRDTSALSQLVVAGDVIKVSVSPVEATDFFFAGGDINSPGQKAYHAGLTLTQAVLASGGPSSTAGNQVRVSRQGRDGRLVSAEYNLRDIQSGKIQDPTLRVGDRIEVTRDK
jgi:protein involved in polysaccharide export with SLBB domain